MSSIVGVFASNHGPLMARNWDDVKDARLQSVIGAFAELRKRMQAVRPDVLIAISPDHWINFFIDNLPGICIGVGETHNGPPEPWLSHLPFKTLRGHPELANHILQTACANDFEPSASHHLTLDHGIGIPLWKIALDTLPPIVPILVNDLEPPMPSVRRCLAWGELLARAVESFPGDLRVAVLATGGMSHSIGEPDMGRVDEPFDRECLRRLEAGDSASLIEFLNERMDSAGNGSHEMRNWVMAHGAARGRGYETLYYAPIPEWYVGCGFAAWNL